MRFVVVNMDCPTARPSHETVGAETAEAGAGRAAVVEKMRWGDRM